MKRGRSRGMTLLEILVSLAILAMISLLVYGAVDSLSRGKKAEALRNERSRQGRSAILRMVRELSSAYISQHTPTNLAMQTRQTIFSGKSSSQYDRLDFTAFAHRRTEADSKESDQSEIGYFVVRDPNQDGKMDLVRREQFPIDLDATKGGIVNVLAEDVESFELRYLDPVTSQWVETWDTTQAQTGQGGRLPFEVHIKLVLANPPPGVEKTYTTKVVIPMQQPLSFGIPR
ncbi:prepilin-type N-terminal cleavage/methylation domain-containing protein [Pendulispora brunnea]|uniref:Type II secretion system protein J n=1 Tax=Pendulispora brunnea TaxID=2905690 RepID=A0ABZ2KKN5_9BACT